MLCFSVLPNAYGLGGHGSLVSIAGALDGSILSLSLAGEQHPKQFLLLLGVIDPGLHLGECCATQNPTQHMFSTQIQIVAARRSVCSFGT